MVEFAVNGAYANRKGKYTVLAITPPKMTVRYEDGTEAELNMSIQARIWENIEAEREAENASRAARKAGPQVQHFIKVVNVADGDAFPGWAERVVAASPEEAERIKPSDRLIYYAIDSKRFFAVATVTGDAFTADPKEYFFKIEGDSHHFFPVDVDATTDSFEDGIPVESVELESQPTFRKLKPKPESYVKINEDDFELLAEWITELTEEDFDEEDLDDEIDLYAEDEE